MSTEKPVIKIKEYRGQKHVTFTGMDHLDDEDIDMKSIDDNYGDAIVELHDIAEDYEDESLDQYWNIGRVMDLTENREKFSSIYDFCPFDIGNTSELRRYHKLYTIFPNGNYSDDIVKTAYMEFCMIGYDRLDDAQDALNRLMESDRSIRYREARSWTRLDDNTFEAMVHQAADDLRTKKNPTVDSIAEKLNHAVTSLAIMEGINGEFEHDETLLRGVAEDIYKAN